MLGVDTGDCHRVLPLRQVVGAEHSREVNVSAVKRVGVGVVGRVQVGCFCCRYGKSVAT